MCYPHGTACATDSARINPLQRVVAGCVCSRGMKDLNLIYQTRLLLFHVSSNPGPAAAIEFPWSSSLDCRVVLARRTQLTWGGLVNVGTWSEASGKCGIISSVCRGPLIGARIWPVNGSIRTFCRFTPIHEHTSCVGVPIQVKNFDAQRARCWCSRLLPQSLA